MKSCYLWVSWKRLFESLEGNSFESYERNCLNLIKNCLGLIKDSLNLIEKILWVLWIPVDGMLCEWKHWWWLSSQRDPDPFVRHNQLDFSLFVSSWTTLAANSPHGGHDLDPRVGARHVTTSYKLQKIVRINAKQATNASILWPRRWCRPGTRPPTAEEPVSPIKCPPESRTADSSIFASLLPQKIRADASSSSCGWTTFLSCNNASINGFNSYRAPNNNFYKNIRYIHLTIF